MGYQFDFIAHVDLINTLVAWSSTLTGTRHHRGVFDIRERPSQEGM